MSKEIWIDIMKSFVSPLIVGAVVAWLTARLSAKYSRSAETPSDKPLSRTQLLIRRIGRFIKRYWADLVFVPLTYVLPVRSFLKDLTAPADNVRVFVMWAALDAVLLSVISAFWLSMFVSRMYAEVTARELRRPGHKPKE
jgi:hypothetical protein